MDSQSINTTEEGSQSNGYDAHKNIKGRKRHLLVDTLGLPLSIYVTPANVQDRAGARLLLVGLKSLVPCLQKIWADGAYTGEELARWCEQTGEWELISSRAGSGSRRFHNFAQEMDRGADFLMVGTKPSLEQGLPA
jgi:putative transposase